MSQKTNEIEKARKLLQDAERSELLQCQKEIEAILTKFKVMFHVKNELQNNTIVSQVSIIKAPQQ